ncbi:MAG: cell division protein FtsQ/DivIB [Candidatus Binatia bacterium]
MIALPSAMSLTSWRKVRGRKENRRKLAEAPPRRRWYVVLLSLVVASFYAPAGWSIFSSYVCQHPYFAVREITVVTEAPFTEEEIIAWSRISLGTSIWAVDPEQTTARLLLSPGVREAEVRREFPQRVNIRVQARRPLAVIVQPSLTYLDEEGEWFLGHRQSKELDLPYITGLEQQGLDTLVAKNAVTGVLPFLSLAKKLWTEAVSEVHWDQGRGYTLFLLNRRIAICLGWEATPEKFTHVATVLAQWPMNGPPVELDARFANQVVVRPFMDEHDLHTGTVADPL